MKRLFDVVASGLGLLVLSPLFFVLAIWIKLDSPGPVFYRQVRVGRLNKDFRIFKFRSMRVGSDKSSLVTIGGGMTPGLPVPGISSGSSNWMNCRNLSMCSLETCHL